MPKINQLDKELAVLKKQMEEHSVKHRQNISERS